MAVSRSSSASALKAIAGVVTLEALRGRMVWLLAAIVLSGLGLAEFTGDVAITESRETVRGLLGAWLRVSAVFVVALFVVTSMVRDWNDKGIELVLALAVPRSVYLFGRLAGYWSVALVAALVCGVVMLLYVSPGQAALWTASLACELILVAALAVLCLLTFSQVTLGMSAVIAFYLLARSIAAIQLIGQNPLLGLESTSQIAINGLLSAIAFLLPDLDRFTRSEWLVYESAAWGDLAVVALQTAVYLLLLCGASMFDLQRKVL